MIVFSGRIELGPPPAGKANVAVPPLMGLALDLPDAELLEQAARASDTLRASATAAAQRRRPVGATFRIILKLALLRRADDRPHAHVM